MSNGSGSNNMNIFLQGRLNVGVSFANIKKDLDELQAQINTKGLSLKVAVKLNKGLTLSEVNTYVKEVQDRIKNVALKINVGFGSSKDVKDNINKYVTDMGEKIKPIKLNGSLNINETVKRISDELGKVEERLAKRPLKLSASVNGVNFNNKTMKEAAGDKGSSSDDSGKNIKTGELLNLGNLNLNRQVKKFHIKDGQPELSSKISEFTSINDKFKGIKVVEDANGNVKALDEIIDKAKKAKSEAQDMVKTLQMGRNIDFGKTKDLANILKSPISGTSGDIFKAESVNHYMDELTGVKGTVKNLKFDYDQTGKSVAKFAYELQASNGKVYTLNYNLDLQNNLLKQEEKVSIRSAKAKADLSSATEKQLKDTRQLTQQEQEWVKSLEKEGKVTKEVNRLKVDRSGNLHLAGSTQTMKSGTITRKRTLDANGNETNISDTFDHEKEAKDILAEQIRIKRMGVLVASTANDPQLKQIIDQFSAISTRGDLKKAEASLDAYIKKVYGAEASLKSFQRQTDATGRETINFEAKLKTGKDQFEKIKSVIDTRSGELRQGDPNKGNELTRNLGFFDILAKGAKWFAVLKTINFATQGMQFFFQSIRDVDTAMIELKKVTNETNQTYRDFGLEAGQIGKTVARSASDVIKATAEFARLGYTIEQAKKLAQNALLLSNVSDLNEVDASKAIVSAIKGFGVEVDSQGKNVRKVVDIYNEIGNNYAISTGGIAEAVKRSASSMKESGNTLEQTVALITSANSVVQDPESVGTALKTIAQRLRGISEEGDDLGTTLLPQLEKSFGRVGLTLKASDNTFKSTFQIMKELSGVWGKLSEFDRADILEKVAGKRQSNIVAAMLNNWKDAEGALESAHNSTGSAARENEKALDSIDAKIRLLIAAFQNLSNTVADSSFFKFILDLLTGVVNLFTTVIDKVGATQLVFIALGARLGGMTNIFATVGKRLRDSITSLASNATRGAIAGVATEMGGVSAATTAATASVVSLESVLASLGIGAIIAGIGFLIQKTIEYTQNNQKAVHETKMAVDAYSQQKKTIKELTGEYENLKMISKLSKDEQLRLVEVQNKLADLLPQLKIGTDANGNAIIRNAIETRRYLDVLDNLEDKAYKERKNSIYEQLKNDIVNLNKAIKDQSTAESQSKERDAQSKKFKEIGSRKTQAGDAEALNAIGADGLNNFINDWFKGGDPNMVLVKSLKEQNDLKLKFSDNFKAMVDLYEQQAHITANVSDNTATFIADKFLSADAFKDLSKVTDTLIDNTIKNVSMIRQLMSDAETSLKKPLDTGETFKDRRTATLKALNKELDNMKDKGVNIDQIKAIMDFFANFADDYRASLASLNRVDRILNDARASIIRNSRSFIDDNKLLADSLHTIEQNGQLGYESIINLVDKYPDLMKYVYAEAGQLKIKTEGLLELKRINEQEHEAEIQRTIDETEMERIKLEQVGNNLLAEIGFRQTINELRKQGVILTKAELKGMRDELKFIKMSGGGKSALENDPSLKYLDEKGSFKEIDDIMAGLDKADKEIENYKNFLKSLKNVDEIKALSSDSKDKKFEPYLLNTYENMDRELDKKIKINQFIAESIKDKQTKADGSINQDAVSAYRDAISSEVELLKQRQDLAHTEADRLREKNILLEGQFSGMANSTDKNDLLKEFDDNKKKIDDLGSSWMDFANNIRQLTEAEKGNVDMLKSYNGKIKENQDRIDSLKGSQDDLKKSSKQYRDNLGEQLVLLKDMQNTTQNEIDVSSGRLKMYKDLYNSGNLVQEQRKMILELMQQEEDRLSQLGQSYKDYGKQIKETNSGITDSNKEWVKDANKLADDIIDTMKKAIEQQKNDRLAGIDELIDAEKKAHDKKIKDLDEEDQRFEESINKKIKLLDKEENTRSYNKDLEKEIKAKNDIQGQIDKLRLDNSPEAKAKVVELEKQLADQTEKIDEIKHKREVDLRKEGLQDQIDTNKKDTEEKKKKLDNDLDNFNAEKEREKKKIEQDAKEMIDDERNWSKIRENILHGNIENLKTELNGYWKTFTDLANTNTQKAYRDINKNLSLADEVLKRLQEIAKFDYGSIPNAGADLGDGSNFGNGDASNGGSGNGSGSGNSGGSGGSGGGNGGSGGSGGSGGGSNNAEFDDEKQYLKNKIKYFEIMMQTGESMNAEQKSLNDQNASIRGKYSGNPKFADFNKDQLIQMNPYGFATTVSKFRKYIKNKLDWTNADEATKQLLAKENGEIRGQYKFKDFTLDEISRLGLSSFDTGGFTGNWSGNGGRLSVLHKKEQVFNENDTQNLLMAARLVKDITPLIKALFYSKPDNQNTTSGVQINKIELNVASLNGDKKGAQLVLDTLVDGLKEKGVKI